MPTVRRIGPYRFFFYANDRPEPPHIHVEGSSGTAKFWLEPIVVETSQGFSPHELRGIGRHVREHAREFLEAWDAFFNATD